MNKFAVKQQYTVTDWFSGGQSTYTVKSIKGDQITFAVVSHELDGTFKSTEKLTITIDENGNEQVVLFTYADEVCRIMAKEEEEMKNTTAKINFRHEGVIYTTEKEGYYYAQPIGGIKKRIAKDAFNKAYTAYVNGQVSDEEWQAQADADKAQQDAARQAQDEADEKAVLGDAPKATEEAQEQPTDEQPSETEKAPKKAKKAPRKSKDIAYTYVSGAGTLTLTAKQVDFIKHIPDTNFYEHGLESILYCDILADEIGGQFARKPMTTGAMISTLREKGVIEVGIDRVNGRKCKIMAFTARGVEIAKELGLK